VRVYMYRSRMYLTVSALARSRVVCPHTHTHTHTHEYKKKHTHKRIFFLSLLLLLLDIKYRCVMRRSRKPDTPTRPFAELTSAARRGPLGHTRIYRVTPPPQQWLLTTVVVVALFARSVEKLYRKRTTRVIVK